MRGVFRCAIFDRSDLQERFFSVETFIREEIGHCFPDEDIPETRKNTLLDSWTNSLTQGSKQVKTPDSQRARKFVLARELAVWISVDLLPFSFVDGMGLKRFFLRKGLVSSASEIPCRSTISRKALDDAYDGVKRLVCEKLPNNLFFHVSTDTWTDRYRQLPYIAVVLHQLDDDFNLMCTSWKTDYFPSPHTGNAISEEISRTINEFGLSERFMFAAVTDSASNMVKGFEDFVHIRCADHRIHRALTADFYKTSTGQAVLLHRSRLMKIYRHLIYKKRLIADMAKKKAQDVYLETLSKAEELEMVSMLSSQLTPCRV